MLLFQKVRWKNFLSTGNDFNEIVLDKTHTTICLGESGSGKSTFLDALSFVLFNKPFRSIKKSDLVNCLNKKDCLVEVEFRYGNHHYLVRRGIKPNIFEIYKNKKLINQDAKSVDYQSYLESEILKFNFKSFKQIIVLGAAGFTPFMNLKPSDRRIIIEELLDIEIFSVMGSILKKKISSIKQDLDEVDFNISIVQEKIKLNSRHISDIEQERKNKIEYNLQIIEENKKQMESLQECIVSLYDDIEKMNTTIDDQSLCLSQKKDLDYNITEHCHHIKELQKKIGFWNENDNCPTCFQHIEENFKKDRLEILNDELSDKNKSIKSLENDLDDILKRLNEIKNVSNQISKIQKEISTHNSSISSIKKYIAKIAQDTIELKSLVTEDKKPMSEDLEDQLDNLLETKKKLIEDKSYHDVTLELLKDGGIKARIIKQYIPLINKFTNKFLASMDFFVTFTMDEEFNEQIKSRGRDDFTYECFSNGEKQRIDLALLFTWRTIARMKNSINTNLLVLDEVLDSNLDVNATENVMELLNSEMLKNSNIIVISHKHTIADKFDRSLKFTKKKNFSIILE